MEEEKEILLEELKTEFLKIVNSIDDNNFTYDGEMDLWYDGLSISRS